MYVSVNISLCIVGVRPSILFEETNNLPHQEKHPFHLKIQSVE